LRRLEKDCKDNVFFNCKEKRQSEILESEPGLLMTQSPKKKPAALLKPAAGHNKLRSVAC